MTNEQLDRALREAVIAAVEERETTGLSLSQVIDRVFDKNRDIPRFKVRTAVLDLLYDQELVHDAKGIVRMAPHDAVEPVLCR